MPATLTSSLIVRLLDGVTAPARKVAASLRGIGSAVDAVNKQPFSARIGDAVAMNNAKLAAVRGQMLDAVGAAYLLKRGLEAPVDAAEQFSTMLEDIGQKADIPIERLGDLGKSIKKVAKDTNQSAFEIGKSVDFLLGMGASEEASLGMSGPIGKAATAYRAATEEIAKSAFAVHDNLKVPVEEVALALDAMAKAGKEGGFELRDMANEFPEITAAAQALGMTGVKSVADLTAALEVARKGAGNGAEAATNLKAFLNNLVSRETIANFKKFGISVTDELDAAAKAGGSPVEHMIGVIDKATKGGKADLLAKLFGRNEALQFIRPMLQNTREYVRIRNEALAAQGTVEEDYRRRQETYGAHLRQFNASMDNLNISLGTALLPGLSKTLDMIGRVANATAKLAERFPILTQAVVGATAAIIALRVATIGAAWAGLFMKGGILSLISGTLKLGRGIGMAVVFLGRFSTAIRGAVIGFTMLTAVSGGVMGALGAALSAIGGAIAAITAPVWLTIAAVVALGAAAYAVWRYWGPISAAITSAFRSVTETVMGLPDRIIAAFASMLDWFKGLPARILAAVGSIDIGSLIRWPSFGGGSGDAPQQPVSGHRARGGNVHAGGLYEVGEKGREIFAPGQSGRVMSNSEVGGKTINFSPTININGAKADAGEIVREIEQRLRAMIRGSYSDFGMA